MTRYKNHVVFNLSATSLILSNFFFKDELLDELEELESLEIDEQLLEPVGQSVSSSVAMSLPSVPSRAPAVQKQAQEEDDDLERLKREMAI